ncbi:MAG: hypothetical protein QM537_06005 [Candidatus Symbiobacter sp.]|nr:hypothetical protein [Candidatus Symbiobacter sp.]
MSLMIKLSLIALIVWGLFFVLRKGRRSGAAAAANGAMPGGGGNSSGGGGAGFNAGKSIRIEELVPCSVCGVYAVMSVTKPCGRKNCPRLG